MAESDCPHHDKECLVQLCPMAEPGDLNKCNWFPDEPVCPLRRFSALPWVKKQRKIRRLLDEDAGCFYKPMLDAISRVTKGLRGIDADSDESIERWLKKHGSGTTDKTG